MSGRDPCEEHRRPTPLELLFDLTFVVAIAQAALALRDELGQGHAGQALTGYCVVFFWLWWAWVNSTWFASAYDTDDVPYRLLTLVQMAGVLVFAAGIPAASGRYDFLIIVVGYVVMRMALAGQCLRAAFSQPEGRAAMLRFATGITGVQLGWIGWLALSGPTRVAGLIVLVAAEAAVPAWATFGSRAKAWHPGHIALRYGQFTIIVLGEVVSAIASAVDAAVTDRRASPGLLTIAATGFLLVFAMWWGYFKRDAVQEIRREIRESLRRTVGRSIAHYLIFGAVAALGAGLQVAIDPLTRGGHVTQAFAAFALAIPVATYIVVLAVLVRGDSKPAALRLTLVTAVLVLAAAAATPLVTLPAASVIMVVLVALLLAYYLTKARLPSAQEPIELTMKLVPGLVRPAQRPTSDASWPSSASATASRPSSPRTYQS